MSKPSQNHVSAIQRSLVRNAVETPTLLALTDYLRN